MQNNIYMSWSTSELRVRPSCHETGWSPPVNISTDRFKALLLLWIICVIYVCVCNAFASVHCCLVVTWCKRADLLALVCDVHCDCVTFQLSILGQVWFLIVSIPDHCCLSYFHLIALDPESASKTLSTWMHLTEKSLWWKTNIKIILRMVPVSI